MSDNMIVKNIPEEQGTSINSESNLFGGVLYYLINTGLHIPNWWSFRREHFLHDETVKNDFLSSVVNTIVLKLFGLPFQITANNTSIQQHNLLAVEYNNLLRYSFSRNQTLEKFIRSTIAHDNGGYLFIQGNSSSNQPLTSTPTGLLHLDSTKVQRTGNLEYPILYYHPNGSTYKVHESRLISLVQSPSTIVESCGVGHGFVSKAILLSQHLYDIYLYEGEVLGSQKSEEIIYATGSKSSELKEAFDTAELDSKNEGYTRYGKRVYLGIRDPQGKLGKINLKSLPEQFNKRDDIEVTLTLLAMASGGSPNWFYDSVKSGSTKASAAESTKMGESKLETWYIQNLVEQIELKFCPQGDKLKVSGGLLDVDNNGIKSKIKLNRAQARRLNIESGVTDVRSERLLQLEAGEITQAIFNDLELNDLRLPNGLHVKTLFYTNDNTLKKLLLFIDEPLKILEDEEVEDSTIDLLREAVAEATKITINSSSPLQQNNAKVALVALEWLLAEYTNIYNSSVLPDENILGNEQLNLNPNIPPINNNMQTLPEITPSVTDKVTTESKNKPKPKPNNPIINNKPIVSGLNDDDKLDNENINGKDINKSISVNQSIFSTVKLRQLKTQLRNTARQLWNGNITTAEFVSQCNGIIIEDGQFKDSMFEYVKTLQSYTLTNSRNNGGKLASIYKLVDQFIVHRN